MATLLRRCVSSSSSFSSRVLPEQIPGYRRVCTDHYPWKNKPHSRPQAGLQPAAHHNTHRVVTRVLQSPRAIGHVGAGGLLCGRFARAHSSSYHGGASITASSTRIRGESRRRHQAARKRPRRRSNGRINTPTAEKWGHPWLEEELPSCL